MAYRQYIGARYVPLFDGAWDATKNYEPLTVVDDGNGNSYTSKKDVPAGTPLTDRTYWKMTASFSGAIEQLRRDVNAIQDDVAQAESEISDNLNRIGVINQSINRKILVVSDSYGTILNSDNKTFTDVTRAIIQKTLPTVTMELKSRSSLSFYNRATGYNFVEMLQEYEGERGDVTDIIVVGGANDVGSDRTENGIVSGIMNFGAYARQEYPRAKISIMAAGTCFQSGFYVRDRLRMIQAYQRGANTIGARFVAGSQHILYKPDLLDSGKLHPSSDGVDVIGRFLAAYIDSGGISVSHKFDAAVEYNTATGTWFAGMNYNVENETIFLKPTGTSSSILIGNFTGGRAVSVLTHDFGGYINVGTIDNSLSNDSPERDTHITTPALITYMDGSADIGTMFIAITDSALAINAYCPRGESSGDKMVASVRALGSFIYTEF